MLMIIAKVVASFFLVVTLIVGILKASPRAHNPEHGALAEYSVGFIFFFLALLGLYYLWLK